ncbi:hypothetical protein FQN54_009451 [Arachnomyces sp. PD_36]|nr:hypothetical protein FQN54_009451 [Arachnomyces sp. PD_36]
MGLLLKFESLVTIGVVLLVVRAVYSYITSPPSPDLPWSGATNRPFSKTWARIRHLFNHNAGLEHAYQTYSKKGLACIFPNFIGDQIMLPSDGIEWLINQPDHVLNAIEPQKESLAADYTMGPKQLSINPLHLHLVRRDLTRHVGSVTGDVADEITLCFEEMWGVNTNEWTEVNIVEDMRKMISRISSRVFVGKPLCRDEAYLNNTIKFANAIPMSALAVKAVPELLKPVLARMISAPNNYYLWKTTQWLKPMIKERMEALDRKERDPEFKAEEPNDLLQWAILAARESGDPNETTPKMLAGRILIVNFASIHTSTFTITNALLDLISGPKQAKWVAAAAEEVTRVYNENNGVWTRPAVAKLNILDSIIRESMRFSGILSQGLVRKVVAPEGIMFRGTRIPQGSIVAVPVCFIHSDTDIFSNDAKYDAFRFVPERQESNEAGTTPTSETQSNEKTLLDTHLENKKHAMVSTSEQHLAFGHGRHACPGRFFASNEIKLMISFILQNYEIEPLKERPANIWIHDVAIPPEVKLRVRRKAGTV